MSTPRIQGPDGSAADPRPRTEPVLALTAAAAAGVGQLLSAGRLWIVLDLAAVLAAVAALALLLRALAVERDRPALAELSTGVVVGGISAAVLLLAWRGPEAYVGTLVLDVAAGMGTVLAVLIIGGAAVRLVHERPAAPRPADRAAGAPAGVGRLVAAVTVLAAAVAVAVTLRDAVAR